MPQPAHTPVTSGLHPEDVRLAELVLQGDDLALLEFSKSYLVKIPPLVRAILHRLGGQPDSQDIPDLIQDCIVVVWRRLPTYRGEASLLTWLFQVCHYELLNGMRRLKKHRAGPRLVGDETISHLVEDPGGESNSMMALDLQAGLSRLPKNEAAILRLKHYEDLTLSEVADRLQLKLSQIRHLYYRALHRLNDYFANRDWSEDSR